ncbi:hypothetical protein MJO29_005278 [Puccinia striiformis f. sp. tritici]|nr:hypothetical protein MJO29_005278 [Puccinia striiformis f. sp. tritici]
MNNEPRATAAGEGQASGTTNQLQTEADNLYQQKIYETYCQQAYYNQQLYQQQQQSPVCQDFSQQYYPTYYDPLQQFNLLNQFSPSPLASQFELFSSYNPSLQQLQYYDPFSPGIAQLHQQQQIQAAPYHQEPFFYDQEPLPQEILQASQLAQLSTIPQYQYSSQARQVLGTRTEDKALHPLEIRRCFNCGDSSHALIGCPEARNEPLIRLTKQIFQAHTNSNQPENGGPDDEQGQQHEEKHRTSRLKDISSEESIQEAVDRRRTLATSYRPGKVSAALREALFWEQSRGLPDENYLDPYRPMPWFQWMEKWGYPPGYAIPLDAQHGPFQSILERIEQSHKDDDWDSAGILEMHRGQSPGEGDSSSEYDQAEEEEEILRMLVPGYEALGKSTIPLPPEGTPLDNTSFPEPTLLPPLPNTPPPPSPPPPPPPQSPPTIPLKRLIKYQGGNFSSDRLPVYNGQMVSTQHYLDYSSGKHAFSSKHSQQKWKNGPKRNHPYNNYQQHPQYQQQHHHHHQDVNSVFPSISISSGSPTSSTTSSPAPKPPQHPPNSHPQDISSLVSSSIGGQRQSCKDGKQQQAKNPSRLIKQKWKDAALTFAATKAHQALPPPVSNHVGLSHNVVLNKVVPSTSETSSSTTSLLPPPASKNKSSPTKRFYFDSDQPSPVAHHSFENENLLNYDDDHDSELHDGNPQEREDQDREHQERDHYQQQEQRQNREYQDRVFRHNRRALSPPDHSFKDPRYQQRGSPYPTHHHHHQNNNNQAFKSGNSKRLRSSNYAQTRAQKQQQPNNRRNFRRNQGFETGTDLGNTHRSRRKKRKFSAGTSSSAIPDN